MISYLCVFAQHRTVSCTVPLFILLFYDFLIFYIILAFMLGFACEVVSVSRFDAFLHKIELVLFHGTVCCTTGPLFILLFYDFLIFYVILAFMLGFACEVVSVFR
jgi:hypothetical protein